MEIQLLNRALSVLRRLDTRTALACAYLAAAIIYAVVYSDPYIVLLVTPFFALGCARGKRPLALLALALAPATALLIVSTVKYLVLGLPLVTYDHYFLRSNVLILAYNDWRVATGLVLAAVLIGSYAWTLFSGRGPFSRFEKGGLAVLAAACIVCLTGMQTWDQEIAIWEPATSWPTIKTFVRSLQVSRAQLHLVAKAEAALSPNPPPEAKGFVPPAGGLPNIFFVLQESTFPPALLRPGYKPKTLFADSADQRGRLHVHTYGGGTWRTEFALLTQMRPQEFGNDGLYVFYQLEKRINRSIFTELKKLGYKTMVFYPVPGSFINAAAFYASIGVDEFYDPESLGVRTGWDSGWDWKFPDSVMYDAMLKKVAENKTPVVALMLTINQHGPHDVVDPMTDYTARFADSDTAYGDFIDALAKRGDRAGVVAFGDHQPEFTARLLRDDSALHFTAYDIHCVNFECKDQAPEGRDRPLDIVMLAPTALERFGFGLDSLSEDQRTAFKDCEGDIDFCAETARLDYNSNFARYFE